MFKMIVIFSTLGMGQFTETYPFEFDSKAECLLALQESTRDTKHLVGNDMIYDIHSDGTVYAAYKSSTMVGKCVKV